MSHTLLLGYWMAFIGSLVLACIATGIVASGRFAGRRADWMMVGAIALLLVAGRWPSAFIPGWLNPDESMMLAQALKFTTDPMPWRAIDPGTGGPFNSYALLPLHWLGIELGYPQARMTAMACLVAYLSLLFLAMRRIAGSAAAAVVIVPATLAHAIATTGDGLHYSSELASLVSIGLLAFVASHLQARPANARTDLYWSIATGVCAFIVTMSKLQGVPLAAALSLSIVALASGNVATFLRRLIGIVAGGAAAALGFVALLAAAGVLSDFRISFLELPFAYAVAPLTLEQTLVFIRQAWEMRSYSQAMTWLIGLALLAWPLWIRSEPPTRVILRALSFALMLFAIFLTLAQPGRMFPHYLTYLPLAGCWLWLLVLPWTHATGDVETGVRNER